MLLSEPTKMSESGTTVIAMSVVPGESWAGQVVVVG